MSKSIAVSGSHFLSTHAKQIFMFRLVRHPSSAPVLAYSWRLTIRPFCAYRGQHKDPVCLTSRRFNRLTTTHPLLLFAAHISRKVHAFGFDRLDRIVKYILILSTTLGTLHTTISCRDSYYHSEPNPAPAISFMERKMTGKRIPL